MSISTAPDATTVPPAFQNRRNEILRNAVMLAFRIVIGFLFFLHALTPFAGAWGGIDFKGSAAAPGSFMWIVGVVVTIGAVLIALGLFFRPAAIILSGLMAAAYFMVHQPLGALPPGNYGEPAALFSWIFLLLAAVGPGAYALDALRKRG